MGPVPAVEFDQSKASPPPLVTGSLTVAGRERGERRAASKGIREGGWTLQPSAKTAARMNCTASEQKRKVRARNQPAL
jgi:hypothetical protein